MEKLIDELIENAQSIYKLYLKVKECNTLEEIEEKEDEQEKYKKALEKQKNYKELISYLKEKEEKLLNQVVEYYTPYLSTFVMDLMIKLDIFSLNVLDNYVEVNPSMLPYLRVFFKLIELDDDTNINLDENNGNLLLEEQNPTKQKESEQEKITNIIMNSLELENMLRFVNVSQNEILENVFSEKVKDQGKLTLEVEAILDQIPYDIAFLNETMEELFLKDGKLNLPWEHYSVLNTFEDEFSSIELLNAIDNYNLELAIGEINKLLSPRKTRTNKVAYLRSLYVLSLIGSFDESTYFEFFGNNKELIEQIESPYSIIKRIQDEAEKYLVEEDIEIPDEIKKQEVTLKRQKPQKSKNSNGEGVN